MSEHHPQTSILIFEDDLDLAWQWRDELKAKGYHVDHVWKAEAAKRLCRERRYNLIICDIFLRDQVGTIIPEGGVSLIYNLRLKASQDLPKWTRKVPIIVVTASNSFFGIDPLHPLRNFEGISLLRKPIPSPKLMEMVEQILSSQGTDHTSSPPTQSE